MRNDRQKKRDTWDREEIKGTLSRMVASAQLRRNHQEPHQALKGDLEMQKKNKTQGFYRKIQKDPALCPEGRAGTLPRALTGAAGR